MRSSHTWLSPVTPTSPDYDYVVLDTDVCSHILRDRLTGP